MKDELHEMHANYWEQPWHGTILQLCEEHGFGAVMQSASEQWRKRDPIGAISLGHCFGTLERMKHEG